MSISELLPAVHALPAPDKLRLMRILAEDLESLSDAPARLIAGDFPIWSPYGADEAAKTLYAMLETDRTAK